MVALFTHHLIQLMELLLALRQSVAMELIASACTVAGRALIMGSGAMVKLK
jgi:hypothetical protein